MAKRRKKAVRNNYLSIYLVIFLLITVIVLYFTVNDFRTLVNSYLPFDDLHKDSKVIESSDLQVHFLELGNEYTGDSVYINAGGVDILIDAGSRNQSSTTITNYIREYVDDGKLEYVIATHAHQDHIAGFVGTSTNPSIFDRFAVETLIDFPKSESSSAVYKNYQEKRAVLKNNGTKVYNALECYNNTNGAKRVYDLTDTISLEVLYNYYYEHDASTENNYSVCVQINQQVTTNSYKRFLFTGDLEENGEKKLVESNNLSQVEVFKAGHHGSYTANSKELLQVIKPKIVCVCCCAGSDEYTKTKDNMFPSQIIINNVASFTDKVYVTSIDSTLSYPVLNGNICVFSNSTVTTVTGSNNDTIFKETKWFKENRKWPE